MRTLQEKYNAVLEGGFSKTQFRRDAAMELPQFVSNVNSFDDTVAILKNKGIVTEESPWGDTSHYAAMGLELKSLAKQLYLGFKKMGAKVRFDANRKKSPIGDEYGKLGLDQLDIFIFANEDGVVIQFIEDRAMSYVDRIMNDPKFSKFNFTKKEIKTWGGKNGLELTVAPKTTKKGATSVTEAKKNERYFESDPADHISPDVLDTGIKCELEKKFNTTDVTPEQYEKAKEAAVKNLTKDRAYYAKESGDQLETPAEQMEKVSLKEGKAEAWAEYQKKHSVTDKTVKVAKKDFEKEWEAGNLKEETDALFARNLKAKGYDYDKMRSDLGDAVAAGEGLEDASAEELEIYAQIATRLGDHIDVVNSLEYLESLPNYKPEFTPGNLRKDEEVNEAVDTDDLRAKIANILKGQLSSLNKMGGDAIIEDYLETQIQAYLDGDVDVEEPMEVVNDFREYMEHNQSAAADFNADLEPDNTTPETLEENQYSISDVQNKFPDKAFAIQQAALQAVGAGDVEAAYTKSAGEFEKALYKAAHSNLEEDQDFTLTPDEREEKEREKFASYSTGKERKALKEMFKKIIVNLINE